jgi:hypothetical protein
MAIRVNRTRGGKKMRLLKPHWIDPFPHIPGTEPEKRVFALLVAKGIYFIYQGQIPEFEKGKNSPMYFLAPSNYKPDFVLPEYKLIIDPFSPFHHSQKEAVDRDIRKVASYAAAGYAYYHPWAIGPGIWTWDQITAKYDPVLLRKAKVKPVKDRYGRKIRRGRLLKGNLNTLEMLSSIPELGAGPRYPLTDERDIKAKKEVGYRIGQYLGAGANSVAASNRKRRKPGLRGISTGSRVNRRRSRSL